jgi:RNA polymerase sigma factor (sigma-70 family)
LAVFDEQIFLQEFANPVTRDLAFGSFVRKYQQRIYWHIRKMVIDHDDANDVTQDTFIKAWHNLERFRNDSKLFTWLYRIATNECLTFLEKKRKRVFLPLEDVEGELSKLIDHSDGFSGDEIALKLQKAILTLPEKQRLVFNMKYFDDLTYEEMSEILGTSIGALKASFHIASKKIESIVENIDISNYETE